MMARRSSMVPAVSASQLGSATARRPKSAAAASGGAIGACARSEARSPFPCSSASTASGAPRTGNANTNDAASAFSLELSARMKAIGSNAAR